MIHAIEKDIKLPLKKDGDKSTVREGALGCNQTWSVQELDKGCPECAAKQAKSTAKKAGKRKKNGTRAKQRDSDKGGTGQALSNPGLIPCPLRCPMTRS